MVEISIDDLWFDDRNSRVLRTETNISNSVSTESLEKIMVSKVKFLG
jgi:hypothetical protein